MAQLIYMFLPLGALAEDDVGSLEDFLRENNCKPQHFRGFEEMTLLHHAVQQGSHRVVEWLVDPVQGIDINARNVQGRTALYIAASTGLPQSKEVIEILLKAGADPSIPTCSGSTPLMAARNEDILRMLLGPGAEEKGQVFRERVRGIKENELNGLRPGLAESVEDESCKNDVCGTIKGSRRGQPAGREGDESGKDVWNRREGIKQRHSLVEIDMQDEDGHTALHYAMFGRLKAQWAVPLLLAAGANPWIRDRKGKLPVYYVGYKRPASVERSLRLAMANPPPRVWMLCRGRAIGAMTACADGVGRSSQRNEEKDARQGVHVLGTLDALPGNCGVDEEKTRGQSFRRQRPDGILSVVEVRRRSGRMMPRLEWEDPDCVMGAQEGTARAEHVTRAVVEFVIHPGAESFVRKETWLGLPCDLFIELVDMMDWNSQVD